MPPSNFTPSKDSIQPLQRRFRHAIFHPIRAQRNSSLAESRRLLGLCVTVPDYQAKTQEDASVDHLPHGRSCCRRRQAPAAAAATGHRRGRTLSPTCSGADRCAREPRRSALLHLLRHALLPRHAALRVSGLRLDTVTAYSVAVAVRLYLRLLRNPVLWL
jgi:hypothetical protein